MLKKKKRIGFLGFLIPHTSTLKKFLESGLSLRETREHHLKCLVMALKRLFLCRVPQMEETKRGLTKSLRD